MPEAAVHPSLFEEDYLLRELGQVAHVPQVALTELVANAWDAGASRVDLVLPAETGGTLTVTDNGHGMTPQQFRQRWMTLRYDRLKHQGSNVEFPPGRFGRARRAYGRNGVGRHGLLCFADEYQVETWRDGVQATYIVGTESGPSPFVWRSESLGKREGNGTRLSVEVARKLPDAEEILTVLAARFIHDPEFEIRVNGALRPFAQIDGRVSEETLDLGAGRSATVIVIDSTRLNHSSLHQGIAFWVQRRLVGTPSWTIGQVANFDGRTRFARRYKVIVDTQGFDAEVEPDWTGFRMSDAVRELYRATAEHIGKIAQELAAEIVDATSEDALTQNRTELAALGRGARLEVAEFTKVVAQTHPTISPDFLATAVKAVIHLEKTKSGAALLQKLSALSHDDVDGLDRLLEEWTVKDALRVLDEIDSRISVIETVRRLADDPHTDELHTLHPLILRSRWLFGPEFESQEYCSNATLQTVARELFKTKNAQFINERHRPDIVVLSDKTTWQLTGIESFDPADPTLTQLQNILLIELKKGGFELTRNEVNQADGYVQDIAASGALSGTPYICAWVVGQKVAKGVGTDKRVGDTNREYGRLRATTFGTLVDTANRRLLKMRDLLASRYADVTNDALLNRVFAQPVQEKLM
ncbi:ATP-binding protein [Burkholderia pseudomallei]|uniref:ATP-binding protein n=1 Tax=Burkholderia pseudomallei TaxID=28450 RepID=UPI000F0700F0|nr:ATP-binding protein [Burkholderia pseudomallei]VBI28453.1 DNA mismatch repair enzyme (predicted ATPase) [Burkholderia pseudomallei]